MDSDENGRIRQEKMEEDAANHNSAHAWSNLRSTPMNLAGPCNSTSTPMNLAGPCNSTPSFREEFMGDGTYCSSAPMADSFGRELWDRASVPSLENFGCCELSGHSHNNSNPSDTSGIRRVDIAAFRSDVGWNPQAPMSKSGLYAPNTPNMLPGSFCLPQFPTDSGFIERAARFSCFNGASFTGLVNPFVIPESISCYPVGPGLMPGPAAIFQSNCVKSGSNLNVKGAEDVDLASKQDTSQGCPQKDDRKCEGETIMRCHDGAERGTGLSSNDSDEGDYHGNRGSQADTSMADSAGGEGSSLKDVSLRKRKRNWGTEAGSDKANEAVGIAKNDGERQRRADKNPGSATSKGTGKNNKLGTPTSDPSKGEYIHIRARRGQATNSHSLAERVRREKISERMKLLQDLVPGCSKVTGKAVMLDEIINYVQSLQRQVEFLSMKLSTVNPRLDCNIEGLLAKEMIQQRAGPSTLGISPEMSMAFPQMHGVAPGMVHPDGLGRAIHGRAVPLSAGLREPSQVPHNWEDELHSVIQMGFGSDGAAPRGQDVDESLAPDNMKVEL